METRSVRTFGSVVCAVSLLLSAACGDDDGAKPALGDAGPEGATPGSLGIPSDDPGVIQTSCTRDPKLMAAARECGNDGDCACGTGCELGKCVAVCKADKDCGDKGACDRFGRCRKGGDPDSVTPLVPPTQSTLRATTAQLTFVSMDDERPVTFVTDREAAGVTRIKASGSLVVRCGDDGSYAAECTFKDLKAGSSVTVWAKLTKAPTMAIQPKSNLHVGVSLQKLTTKTSAGGITAVTKSGTQHVGAIFDPTDHTSSATEQVLQSGAYEGIAQVTRVGTASDPAVEGGSEANGITLKLTATIYAPESGTAGVIVLNDPRKVFAPSGSWTGSISSGAQAQVKLPSAPFLKSDAWSGAGLEVLAEAPAAKAVLNAGNVSFDLNLRLRGLLASERAPFVRWSIVLSKTAELPDGMSAPSVPTDAKLTASADRAFTRLPWENALRTVFGAADVSTLDDAARQSILDAFPIESAAGAKNLTACAFDPAGLDQLGLTAARKVWNGPMVSPSLPTRLGGPFRAANMMPTIAASIDPKLRTRAIPCAVEFEDSATNSTCVSGSKYHLQPVDICDAVAAEYGCDVIETSDASKLEVTATGSITSGGCSETLKSTVVRGNVRRACQLPPVAQGCAEMALCLPRVATSSTSARFGATKVSYSGDLGCEGSDLSLFAADVNLAKSPCSSSDPACDRLGAQGLIDACATELARVQKDAAPGTNAGDFAQLPNLLAENPACVDAARFVTALGLATEADRNRAREPDTAKTALASRVAQRLLQRYLSYGAFQAREAAQRELLGEMFRAAEGRNKLASADEVLAKNLPLWDLVLHPRFATAIDQIPGELLATPDYRPLALGQSVTSEAEHEQTLGLPIALLDLANAQLALLEPRLEWAALDRDLSALDRLAEAVRYTLVVRPLAAALYERAKQAGGAAGLSWGSKYLSANAEIEAHLNKLGMAAAAIVEGRNPLGVEDDDLPLYFYGDEETPTTRYSAVSDFLIGQMPGAVVSGSTWAPNLVDMARVGWETAMPLFIDQLDREIQVKQANNDRAQALDEMRLDYGSRLAEYCYPSDLDTIELVEEWKNFSPDNCFFNAEKAGCEIGDTAQLSPESMKYQMCVISESHKISNNAGFAARGLDAKLDMYANDFEAKCSTFTQTMCKSATGTDVSCIECSDGMTLEVSPGVISSVLGASAISASAREKIEKTCLEKYPTASAKLPGQDDAANPAVLNPECYNGSIGEAVFDLRQARQEAREAQAEFEGNVERYARALDNCSQVMSEGTERQVLRESRDDLLNRIERTKTGLDSAAEYCDAAADCIDTVVSVLSAEDIGKFLGPGLAIGGCVSRFAGASFRIGSLEAQRQLDETERAYQQLIDKLDEKSELRQCLAEAASEFVQQKAQAVRVAQAASNVAESLYRIQELKISAATVMADGRAALDTAKGRFVAPLAHDFWIGDQAKRFWRDMRMARRVTYLAVRAVEYEQQVSLPLRDTVLKSRLPDELWSVLEELWSMSGQRSVRGNRPTDLKVVLSLRNQLLQIADLKNAPKTEQRLSEVERFRLLLTSPQNAAYDNAGKYLGQRIPFTLAPLSAVSGGQSQGVPVLAGTDCAERLWSVNASVLGPEDLYVGDEPTFARVDILKSNTFFSQWCGSPPAGAPIYQTASVRPSRNLFRDPEYGVAGGVGAGLGLENQTGAESRARIEAYFNVERADFEADDYASGATSELAARGLYGEYALFIPRDVLALNGGNGLALDKVEDILLRLDYVSVAK
ncbi:MAG TPA: hypothetical protein VFG30_41990 [Polyangiales bacterium]|nr:hypothetical protein [Polyangiales bacterium]